MNIKYRVLVLMLAYLNAYKCMSSDLVRLKSEFNQNEIKWVLNKGSAVVNGSAYIVLENGQRKGCASSKVELLPEAKYSNERIHNTYGNNSGGQILISQNPPKFYPDVKKYHEMLISTKCNEGNNFEFKNVPEGNYYIIAFIIWDEPHGENPKKQGGAVMKKIQVKEGSSYSIDL